MARIILAEDHAIFREGLKALLKTVLGLEVVAETGDGLEALDLVQAHYPDILIVDLSLPGLDGLEVTRRTVKRTPDLKVIVLSMHSSEPYVLKAVRNGAMAYVLKSESMKDLSNAIEAVLSGRRFFSASLQLDTEASLAAHASAHFDDPYDKLTKREREVLQLVAEGHTSPEIADRLFISLFTVNKHRSNMMEKLGMHSQTEIVHFAVRRGLIALDSKPGAVENES